MGEKVDAKVDAKIDEKLDAHPIEKLDTKGEAKKLALVGAKEDAKMMQKWT